ncbi:MAG: hypothetical protein AAFY15_11435 [Cyanobacteria bacterium J06648_11]
MAFDPTACDRPDCKVWRIGKTSSGSARFLCPSCGNRWSDSGHDVGRPAQGDRAMSNAERQQKCRVKRASVSHVS